MNIKKNKNYLILLLILSLGTFLRIFLFTGMSGYDDFAYSHIAYNIVSGTYKLSDVEGYFGFRYLLLLPTALTFYLFGINKFSISIFPLFCSLGNILLAFFLGKLIFKERVGLYAALLYSFFPLSIVYATILYPDEILPFFLSLSVFLFLKGEKYHGSKSWGLFFLSGLFIGIGYFSRIAALLLFLFYGWHVLYKRVRISYFWCLIGLFSILISESLIYYFLTGDYFFRWHSIFNRTSTDMNIFPTGFDIYPKGMFGFHFYGLALFGFFYPVTAIVILYYFWKRNITKIWLPLSWFISLFLYLEFGTLSFSSYKIVFKQLRFLSILTMPTLLMLATFLGTLNKGKFFSKVSLMLCALLFFTSFVGAYKMSEYHKNSVRKYKEAYHFLKNKEVGKIFVIDPRWELHLNFYYKEPLKYSYYVPVEDKKERLIKDISELEGRSSLKNSYIIIDEEFLTRVRNENLKRKITESLAIIQRDGEVVWEKEKTKIYFVSIKS